MQIKYLSIVVFVSIVGIPYEAVPVEVLPENLSDMGSVVEPAQIRHQDSPPAALANENLSSSLPYADQVNALEEGEGNPNESPEQESKAPEKAATQTFKHEFKILMGLAIAITLILGAISLSMVVFCGFIASKLLPASLTIKPIGQLLIGLYSIIPMLLLEFNPKIILASFLAGLLILAATTELSALAAFGLIAGVVAVLPLVAMMSEKLR